MARPRGVAVITLDSESSDPSSILGEALKYFFESILLFLNSWLVKQSTLKQAITLSTKDTSECSPTFCVQNIMKNYIIDQRVSFKWWITCKSKISTWTFLNIVKTTAPSEDRTHDLQIMRLTRYPGVPLFFASCQRCNANCNVQLYSHATFHAQGFKTHILFYERRGRSSVVERSLRMREAPGSNSGVSIDVWLFLSDYRK